MAPKALCRFVFGGFLAVMGVVACVVSRATATGDVAADETKQASSCLHVGESYSFSFPRDEAPHGNYSMEWMYYNGLVSDVATGQQYSVLANFVRAAPLGACLPNFLDSALLVDFMVVNVSADEQLSKQAFDAKEGDSGSGVYKFFASHEPVAVADGEGYVGSGKNGAWHMGAHVPGNWSANLTGAVDSLSTQGNVHLALNGSSDDPDSRKQTHIQVSLSLSPAESVPFILGDNGIDTGGLPANSSASRMAHVGRPRMRAQGTLSLSGTEKRVEGALWLQHMWGSFSSSSGASRVTARQVQPQYLGIWQWFAMTFDGPDGEVAVQCVLLSQFHPPHVCYGNVVVGGKSTFATDLMVVEQDLPWIDPDTEQPYARRHRLASKAFNMSVTMHTLVGDSLVRGKTFPYYEGVSVVSGWMGEAPVNGTGITARALHYNRSRVP